jgi:hypothetical protein
MKILGYSERGVVNSLLFEICRSPDSLARLRRLLDDCRFPDRSAGIGSFGDATILIEQSFSDFGDADAVLLLDGDLRQCVFVEAKVKTCGRGVWSIDEEWESFLTLLQNGECSSNLFWQLYSKQRLVRRLRGERSPAILNRRWSLGANRVVKRAAELVRQYTSSTWYLAIVPDHAGAMKDFFCARRTQIQNVLPDFNWSHWGYLTWQSVYDMCRAETCDWFGALQCFEHNEGQIFGSPQGPVAFRAGDKVRYGQDGGNRIAIVRRRGRRNSRVILADGSDELVSNALLARVEGDVTA